MGTPISDAIAGQNPMHQARLHAQWKKNGYRYAVLYRGRLIVESSRDPEHDAARALVALGFTGKLTLCDGKSGHPRTIIPDIERAAGFSVSEESRDGLRLRRYVDPDIASPAAEASEVAITRRDDSEEAA